MSGHIRGQLRYVEEKKKKEQKMPMQHWPFLTFNEITAFYALLHITLVILVRLSACIMLLPLYGFV
jgi:hypothetical protein